MEYCVTNKTSLLKNIVFNDIKVSWNNVKFKSRLLNEWVWVSERRKNANSGKENNELLREESWNVEIMQGIHFTSLCC